MSTPTRDDLLIVMPAYNEAGRIGRVLADLQLVLPTTDVLVVDDGSRDATAAEAAATGAIVLSLPVNAGYGAALQTGYKFAVRGDYAMVGQIDADGQHQARWLPEMLALLDAEAVDVVIGSRFAGRDGHYRAGFGRKLGIALFGRMASLATRQRITDPTSGFQLMRQDVARFFCSEVYPTDYPDADILILLHRTGFRIRELAVQMDPSTNASMHAGPRTAYYIYKMLLSIFVTLLRPVERLVGNS